MAATNRIYGYQGGAGDPDSHLRQFTQFCLEHENSIFAYVLKMVLVRDAAEDITQEALLQAYCKWNELVLLDDTVKGCYQIATQLTIKYLRKKGPDREDENRQRR